MPIARIGVIGAGQMGAGIAHVAALAGRDVVLADVSAELAGKGLAVVRKNLARQVEKGKVTAEAADAALARIVPSGDVAAFAEADLVVEAIVENEGVKRELFARLDAILKPGAILASNTSSISITRLGGRDEAPGARHRDALHEPGPGDAARRGDPRHRDVGRDDGGRRGGREGDGEGPGRVPRLSRASSRTGS